MIVKTKCVKASQQLDDTPHRNTTQTRNNTKHQNKQTHNQT